MQTARRWASSRPCGRGNEDWLKRSEAETCLAPQFGAPPTEDDGEPFEEKMARLTKELSAQFAESKKLEEEIRKNLKGLGFDV